MERDHFDDTRQEAWLERGRINGAEAGGDGRVKGWLFEIWETFLHICCVLLVTAQERSGPLMMQERCIWDKAAETLREGAQGPLGRSGAADPLMALSAGKASGGGRGRQGASSREDGEGRAGKSSDC